MAISWTEDLATGVDDIDTQHKELFSRINMLLEACNQGKGRLEVGNVIDFLEGYVIAHFAEEERWMIAHKYPAYPEHKAQHLEFMRNFSKLKAGFEKDGPGVHVVVTTNQMVVDWLRTHIRKLDKALAAFLVRQEGAIGS